MPIISATKVDAILSDDGDSKADPGGTEKIEYTVTVSNTGAGATDATGVVYTDQIDAHTTLVPGSVNTQPIADPDSYMASGNIAISLAAPGVLANDRDPDTGNNTGLTVSQVQGVGANVGVATDTTAVGRGGVKGSVTLNSDGSFTYDPAPGFNGSDSFTYTITDGTFTDTATVNINITQMVWFIQNNGGGSNRGTFLHPFTSIASFNTANAASGAAPDPKNGDFIALRTGTGTYTEADGINLRAQQKLIGNGVLFNTAFTADANSTAAYATFASTAASAPNIVTTAGNGVDLSTDNTVRGLNVGNTPAFFKINGGAVGSPTINTVNLTGTGGALNVSTSGSFGANVVFGTLESTSSPAANLNLVGVTGVLGLTSPGTGFSGSAAASAAINVSGGSVGFTYTGNVTKANAGSLVSISGGHSTGTIAFTTGTLSATSGDGLQFNNADGTYNFSGTTTLNGGDAGVDILNGSSGTFTFSAATTITSPTGTAFNVGSSPGNPNVTYSGTITQNTTGQRAVNIDGTTGNTVSIATVTAGSVAGGVGNTGVNINNAGGNVTFTDLNLGTSGTRMTAQAVTIAGGAGTKNLGDVSIFTTGTAEGIHSTTSTGAIIIGSGTVDTAGAAAANLVGTSAASRTPLNIQLTKVNTTGGSNGIVLQNTSQTGSPGGFKILGNTAGLCGGAANPGSASGTAPVTADCSGGQIQTTTGANGANAGIGILLTDVDKVSLTRVRVNGHSNYGLKGTNVSSFSLTSSYFHNNGDDVSGDGEGGVYFYGLTGSSGQNSITNSFLDLGAARNLHVLNTSGTLDRLTVSGTTIGNDGNSGSDGIFIQADNSANTAVPVTLKATIQNGRFNGSRGDGIQFSARGTSSTDFVFTGNRMTNNHPNQVSGSTAVTLSSGGLAGSFNPTNTFNISNNIINNNSANNASGPAISVGKGGVSADASFVGTISGNQIGTAGVGNSGSAQGSGIVVDIVGGGVMNATITNNTIRQFTNFGILAQSGNVTAGGGTGNLVVDIRGNNIAEPSPASATALFPTSGIRLVTGTNSGDNSNNCATIGGSAAADKNSLSGTGTNGASDLRIFQRFTTILAVTGYPGANNDNTAMQNYMATQNTVTTVTATNNTGSAGPGYSATCTAQLSGFVSTDLAQLNNAPKNDSSVVTASAATVSTTQTSTPAAQPSMLSRGVNAVSNFASNVISLVEPTAHASGNPERTESAAPAVQAASQTANQKVSSTANRKSGKVVSNHARSRRALTPMFAGETVTVNIGTLRAGDSVTIKFQVTVNNPPNLTLLTPPRVSNQGTVSGSNFSNVLTDDPSVGGASDPTETPVDLFDTSTSLVSNLNPSNFGDLVTFTATVSETPAQASADPSGTVDFVDTSNGNAVVCNDVPLSGGSAQCQTSTLTAGTHNIRAEYSGDGNFDPSQNNLVAQVVNACTPNPVVTSTADSGAGTLREAIANVCSGTTITFNIAGPGPHTITLTSGELAVAKNMTIKNNSGESVTVSGNNLSRVFNINSGFSATIIGLTISGGNAANGGGVSNNGTLTVINSTLSGNTATSDGGGISSSATATSLTLINTTISGNTANGFGGGVDVLAGTATIINTTITNNHGDNDNTAGGGAGGLRNQGGTVTLHNTIVAGNFSGSGTSVTNDVQGALQATSSNNLIGDGTNMTGITHGVNGNQVGTSGSPINPQLGALGSNGGTTQTHALLANSPAVEAGSNAALPADTFDLDGDANTAETLPVDQRGTGFPRVADSADANVIQTVDIGAFELHPSVEDIPNQTTNEDTVKNVTFNLGDDTGSLIATVTATSSNTTLVPNANLSFSGSGGSLTLQITPAANQSGTTTITVTVTATNGRTATDTFDLTVTAVNDPPSGADKTVTTAEETPYTFTAADFGFTDPNDTPPNTLLAVKITTLPALGTLTNNNVPVNAGDFIPVADINGGLLKFTPALNGNGTPYTSFTFQVQDNGGGTDLDPTPNTITINVTAVNDGPVNTVPGPQSTNEDTALVFSSGNANQISVADVDAGANPIKITLTATNGTLTLSTIAGLAFTTGDGTADATMVFTGTLTAVNTALNGMSFNPTANFNGAASLQIVSDDQGNTGTGGPLTDTDTVNITVNAVNDPPSGADKTVSTAEDTAYTFTVADFGFTDPNDTPPNTLLAVKITTLPALGTLTNNSVPVNAGDFIPVANISGGLLKFTPAADGNGTPYTTFTFQVQDNGGGTDLDPTPNTITINVTAVNDGPVNTVPGPQSTTENTAKAFSSGNLNQISVADVDAGSNPIKITLTATNGTLTLSTIAGLVFTTGDGTADATMVFTGTLTAVNTALNGMSFNPTADFNGAASLTIVSDDQGNTGSGGPLTDTDTVNITVNAANDAPVVTTSGGNLSYTENAGPTAIDTGLTVTDVDNANLVGATVAITAGFVAAQDTLAFTNQNGITGNYNSGTGVLTLTGSSSVANYQTALRSVTYQNSSDNPTASRTVTFIADDGTSTSTPATRGITINAVNDGPMNTVPGPQSTNQNTPIVFSSGNGNQISVADLDAGSNSVQITLTATNGTITLNGTAGLAFTVGDGTADATMTFTGTLANINTALNGMSFTPTAGFSGAASLTITSNDQGNTGSGGPLSDTDTVNIQVSTNIVIGDAKLVEPPFLTTANMLFTVTLSAPAPASGVSVNFATMDQPPAINHAKAGLDYAATSGTVTFAPGEQIKTISVPIFGDLLPESNETFLVNLSSPVNGTIADGSATGTILMMDQAGTILISELRTSGPAGAGDDFVEIYNNTDTPHTVNDGSGIMDSAHGYGLFKMGADCSATPVLIGIIPNGTVIPARGHYLFVGSAYSLGGYATGDQVLSADIQNDRNVALFSVPSLVGISTATRLDAVGFGSNTGGICDLLREGPTLTPLSGSVLQYSYFRDECGKKGNPLIFGTCPTEGATKDSNKNDDDFIFADTTATSTAAGQRLGTPGPQNLGSPRVNPSISAPLLDATKSSLLPPNRVRDLTPQLPNAAFGTLSFRRRFVNNTGAPITRLRIRIIDITAFTFGGGVADLRAINSTSFTVGSITDSATCSSTGTPSTTPCTVTVQGTILDTPPTQTMGGGLNSSLGAGTVTLGTPLAPGASINLQFLLGVQQIGAFKFYFNIEALP